MTEKERCEACDKAMRALTFQMADVLNSAHRVELHALLAEMTAERNLAVVRMEVAELNAAKQWIRAEAAEARLTNEDGETCLQSIGGTCLAPVLTQRVQSAEKKLSEAVELLRGYCFGTSPECLFTRTSAFLASLDESAKDPRDPHAYGEPQDPADRGAP